MRRVRTGCPTRRGGRTNALRRPTKDRAPAAGGPRSVDPSPRGRTVRSRCLRSPTSRPYANRLPNETVFEGITLIGNVNADVIVRDVSDLPPPGEEWQVDAVDLRPGGAAANCG